MCRHISHRPAARQRGSSLIEVLVALLVCSIGLLGVAGMQARALTSVQESQQRLVATEFAHRAAAGMWLVSDAELAEFRTDQPRFNAWLATLQDPVSGLMGVDPERTSIEFAPGGLVTITVGWFSITDRGDRYAAGLDSRLRQHVLQTKVRHD